MSSRDTTSACVLLPCMCVCRSTDLLLLEVDAEVQEFVATLKDWSLKW